MGNQLCNTCTTSEEFIVSDVTQEQVREAVTKIQAQNLTQTIIYDKFAEEIIQR